MNDELRDKFAIAALPIILADALESDIGKDDESSALTVARAAYKMADAMIEARKGKKP